MFNSRNNASRNSMSSNTRGAVVKIAGSILFVVLALIALYYLYNYLYAPPTGAMIALEGLNGPKQIGPSTDVTSTYVYNNDVKKTQYAQIVSGGEYSVSFWVYVQQWTTTAKPLVSILGKSGNDTLYIYLDKSINTLHVNVSSDSNRLASSQYVNKVAQAQANNVKNSCDITNFELQRWVNVTVTLNSNAVDTFIDGKLARSCVLDGPYSTESYPTVKVNDKLGSGIVSGINGYISNVLTYSYALAPDEVYKVYMAGPDATYSVWTYLLSFFNPNAYGQGVISTRTSTGS